MSLGAVATSAFIAGLLGSLHCAGMCGPLAVAGCSSGRGGGGAPGYFLGRLAAYATLGAIVGHAGKHALCVLPVSAAHAVAVALTALPAAARGLSLLVRRPPASLVPLRKKPRASLFLDSLAAVLPRRGVGLGLATGVLPCGLLFTSFAMAAATASPLRGAAGMAAFAIGSSPGLALAIVGRTLAARHRLHLSPRLEGLLWCALALWLGLRLALGETACHSGMTAM